MTINKIIQGYGHGQHLLQLLILHISNKRIYTLTYRKMQMEQECQNIL